MTYDWLNCVFILEANITLPPDLELYFKTHYWWKSNIPEGREVGGFEIYQGVVHTIDDIEDVKTRLENAGFNPAVVGVWNIDGPQYGYMWVGSTIERDPDIETALYPFDFTTYHNYLADIVTYDAQGQPISSRRPTDIEARDTQINYYNGQAPRDLATHTP